ncbi:MAG: ribonucleotide-diphosphate reductase subunit beta [Hyphomicrobiales bacterium]|nr:ribonucleotide-diphosphate reductase subunit beta [Hyphomicrobiales bacterium]
MSVNLSHIDPRTLIGTGKVGLLTSTGTYNVERYPWACEFWKRQQQTHWMGEEVPLGANLKDWASDRVTEPDRNLLTQIFRFFTQSDVEVGDNYLKRYVPIFQPLELQMMMAAFSNMETVHIDAYALVLKTLGMPKEDAFTMQALVADRPGYDPPHAVHLIVPGEVEQHRETRKQRHAFPERAEHSERAGHVASPCRRRRRACNRPLRALHHSHGMPRTSHRVPPPKIIDRRGAWGNPTL